MPYINQRKLQELIVSAFNYDAETGRILNKITGAEHFTTINAKGYLVGRFCGKVLYAHRVIWVLVKNYWPDQVDHKDRNKRNNKWSNLREVNNSQNHINRVGSKKGAYWTGTSWQSKIGHAGKYTFLGTFKTREEAEAAYAKAKEKLILEEVDAKCLT